MQEIIRFALLGFGVGALYSLASQGLVLIYRGSGVLNFAHGAIGMVGAYVYWELLVRDGSSFWVGLVAGLTASAALGAASHLLIMRPLRRASPLARVVATLGVLITLQAVAVLRYGSTVTFVPSALPTAPVHIAGDILISVDRLILLGLAAVLSLALWALYRFTRFGLGTSAVAENERAAAALGWSPDRIATINWALGSALAALAAILISPIVTLQVTVMTNLVLAALAAALVASFRSFPIAFAAGVAIGIAQTEVTRYVSQPGMGQAVPFIVIVAVMVARGQALPLRDAFLQRLPTIGTGRIRPLCALAATGAAVALLATVTPIWIDALTVTLAMALVLLSIVVLTGYAGQLSLAQYAIAGFGAWIAGRLADAYGLPFWLCVLGALAGAVPLGMLFALPAARTRGINLAVVTLGLGTTLELMLFDNGKYTGGFAGTNVSAPTLFGWSVDAIGHPVRYGLMTLGAFVACALAIANLRRGRSGRRLVAVRTNERAAAALGINAVSVKLYAFALSAGIAALGGVLLAFRNPTINYPSFTNFTSISAVGWAMIGGIGYVIGPLSGATLAPGALGGQINDSLLSGLAKYVPLIGGVSLIAMVLLNQNGIVKEVIGQLRWVGARVSRGRGTRRRTTETPPPASRTRRRVTPRTLEVRAVTVKYGATTAVDAVSFAVRPGRVLGLIGPNGAGKTSLIDAITGFTGLSGDLLLDDASITSWSAARRSRAGLSRSFQSLELFEDSTVLENLRVASDPRDVRSYVTDLVHPVAPPLPDAVRVAIDEFGLVDDLEQHADNLPHGKRRLLAIARAVASEPSVLLLDEPAAGLGDVETAELARVVRRLADDWEMGVLLVEHDMDFVMSVCDEIVVLDYGRKICEGPPDEVRSDATVIAAYLGDEAAAPDAAVTGARP
jgi:ABC-type branched-subunit amino acid transport system ATPase component/ABC-type branched-subunit amino acid transport system permease subunit